MATITTRVDDNVKDDFLLFCDRIGITSSSLFNMFVKACIREQKIPFEVTAMNYEAKRSVDLFKEADVKFANLKNDMTEDEIIKDIMNDRKKKSKKR